MNMNMIGQDHAFLFSCWYVVPWGRSNHALVQVYPVQLYIWTRHGAIFGAKSADSAEFVIVLIVLHFVKIQLHILTNLHWSVTN